MTEPAAAKAALDLNNKLRADNPPWLVAVGYATGNKDHPDFPEGVDFSIIVYTTSVREAKSSVKDYFQNVPVVFKKMGKPRLA